MWRKEYRIVYYSWEFDTLQSFYRDLLRLPQMYGWYTSPVDRGCKFKIGDNRLELICRHPTLPQGPAGMRLEAKDIELCYANLKKEPRVTVIRPLQAHPWGEYSFCIKDPVGNWVEVYQRSEQYRPMGADDGGCYFTDEYTAILFAEDHRLLPGFHADARGHLLGSGSRGSGLPPPLCRRLYGHSAKDGEYAPGSCADHH